MLYCYNKDMATQLPSATLSDLIGMPSDRAVLIGAVREGLSYTLFEDLAEALELAHKDLATLLGIATRTLVRDGKGTVLTTATVTNIALDAKLDPASFSFEVPEGATVTDMSTPSQDTGSSTGENTPSEGGNADR